MTTSTDLKTFKIAKGTKAQIVTAYNNGDIGDTDFAIATDEDYADATLSNVTTGSFENVVAQAQAGGKATVVGWGMPDYSAGVSVAITTGTTYTATVDGIFVGLGNAVNAGSYVRFYVKDSNDTEIGRFGNYSPIRSGDTVSASCIVPLPKGYKIEMLASANAICTFYPLVGA